MFPTVVQTQDPWGKRKLLVGIPLPPGTFPPEVGALAGNPAPFRVSLQAKRTWLSDVYSQYLTVRNKRVDFSQNVNYTAA